MKLTRHFTFAALLGAVVLLPTACKKEGAAEKAGKDIDKQVEESKDKMEKFKQNVEDAIKEGGSK